MYTTIEADIENGKIMGPEADRIPFSAHVLITLLESKEPEKKYDFSDLSGKLEWSGDAVTEQRKLRDEW